MCRVVSWLLEKSVCYDQHILLTKLLLAFALLHFVLQGQTFTTRHIHNWVSFLLWLSHFILSGAISHCPLLFPSSILDTFWPGGLIFWCHIFLSFHTVHGVLQARILEWVAISFSSGPRFVITVLYDHLGWHCMACLIASLSYTSPFTTTRLWYMKGYFIRPIKL